MEQQPKKVDQKKMAKKMAAGMKELWNYAKKDLTGNSQELKQDLVDILEYAKSRNAKRKMAQKGVGSIDLAVNKDAGAELLTHYKDLWADIHLDTEQNSKMATKVALDIQKVDRSVSQCHLIIGRCCDEFSQLPEVISSLENVQKKVESICEQIREVEESLVEYSRVAAELDCERKKHSLRIQHERHCAEQEAKVEHLRDLLADEQRLTDQAKVDFAKHELAERQQTFQDMFNQQMSEYRQHGLVERPITEESKGRSGSQLEEVVIEDEDGNASLNEFLSDIPDETETHDTSETADPTDTTETDIKNESAGITDLAEKNDSTD